MKKINEEKQDDLVIETCLYCDQIIATAPITRHETTENGIRVAIVAPFQPTEIGKRRCTSEKAKNGNHFMKR